MGASGEHLAFGCEDLEGCDLDAVEAIGVPAILGVGVDVAFGVLPPSLRAS